jgi:hypothetical protein
MPLVGGVPMLPVKVVVMIAVAHSLMATPGSMHVLVGFMDQM